MITVQTIAAQLIIAIWLLILFIPGAGLSQENTGGLETAVQLSAPPLLVVPDQDQQLTFSDPLSDTVQIERLYESGWVNSPCPGNLPLSNAPSEHDIIFFTHPDYSALSIVNLFHSSDSLIVSTSFLQMVLKNPVDSRCQEYLLNQYAEIAKNQLQSMMHTMYPAAVVNEVFADTFKPLKLAADSGASALLVQDPYADPYARLSITTSLGDRIEYSISQRQVAILLANRSLSASEKIDILMTTRYRLPDVIRFRFNQLSADELAALIRDRPELDGIDFIALSRLEANLTRSDDMASDVK